STEVFPTASTIKLPILTEFYDQVGRGKLDPLATALLTDELKKGGSGILQ
ncbi:MAG: serine hydrolase, partial [Candidatus Marinimicrobia bacterium CG_4_9_14_3_um_filter_48_9]